MLGDASGPSSVPTRSGAARIVASQISRDRTVNGSNCTFRLGEAGDSRAEHMREALAALAFPSQSKLARRG